MKYKWLIIFLISLSFGLGHIVGLLRNTHYAPFALVGVSKGGTVDEAYCYVPSINAVRFNKPLGDWQAFEHRYDPPVQPVLGPLIFGQVAKVIGLENLYIIVDFIFPPLAFLTFYYLVKLVTKNELLSILASLILMGKEALQSFIFKLGASLVKYQSLDYFFEYLNNLKRPLAFARFDTPQFSFVILILGLALFLKALKTKNIFYYLLTGLLFGLQWYMYSYYAVFVSLVLFSSLTVYLISKDWQTTRLLISAGFVSILTSLLYWSNYLKFINLPQAMDFFHRAGRVDGRWFDKNSLFIILLVPILIWLIPKFNKLKDTFIFIIILLLAAFLCLNFQVFTGFSVQHFHWQSAVVYPVFLLTGALLLSKLEKILILIKPVFILLTILLSASIFFRNFFIAKNTYAAYSKNLKLDQALEWINHNLESGSVIMTPSIESNYWLIVKTKAYIFNPHALHSLAPTSELIERMAITFNIFGIGENYARNFLTYHQSLGTTPHTHQTLDLAGYPYLFYLKYGMGIPQSKEYQTEVLKALKTFQTTRTTLLEMGNKYKIDYLFFGPSEKRISAVNFDNYPGLIKVFDNEGIKIFKLPVF